MADPALGPQGGRDELVMKKQAHGEDHAAALARGEDTPEQSVEQGLADLALTAARASGDSKDSDESGASGSSAATGAESLDEMRESLAAQAARHTRERDDLREQQRLELEELDERQSAERAARFATYRKALDNDAALENKVVCRVCFHFGERSITLRCGEQANNELSEEGCGNYLCEICAVRCDACADSPPYCPSCAKVALGEPDCGYGNLCPDCADQHVDCCEECSSYDETVYR